MIWWCRARSWPATSPIVTELSSALRWPDLEGERGLSRSDRAGWRRSRGSRWVVRRAVRRPGRIFFALGAQATLVSVSIAALVHPRANEALLLPSELRTLAALASYVIRLQQSFSV